MPIIWQTSSIAIFLMLACGISPVWPTEMLFVTVGPKGAGVSIKVNSSTHPLNLDASTAQSLGTAEILHQLGQPIVGKENAVVFIARYPSQRKNPMGRCGAGHEDFLLLFSFDKRQFRLQDKFLLQSCLQTLALASDGEDDPINIVKLASNEPLQIQATWLGHPKYGNSGQTITIRNMRFETHPDPGAETNSPASSGR